MTRRTTKICRKIIFYYYCYLHEWFYRKLAKNSINNVVKLYLFIKLIIMNSIICWKCINHSSKVINYTIPKIQYDLQINRFFSFFFLEKNIAKIPEIYCSFRGMHKLVLVTLLAEMVEIKYRSNKNINYKFHQNIIISVINHQST